MDHQKVAVWALGVSVGALTVWGATGLTQHIIVAVDHVNDSAQALNQALDEINRPKSGLLANADGMLLGLRLTSQEAFKVANHEEHQLATLDEQERQLFSSGQQALSEIHQVAQDTRVTLQAVSKLSGAATDDLVTANKTITAVEPLIESSNSAVQILDARMRDQRIDNLMTYIEGIAGNADGISADAKKVTDKLTNDYLAPKPWWKKLEGKFGDAWDITAAVARHSP